MTKSKIIIKVLWCILIGYFVYLETGWLTGLCLGLTMLASDFALWQSMENEKSILKVVKSINTLLRRL